MKKYFLFLTAAVFIVSMFFLSGCATTGLSKFGAEMGSRSNPIPGKPAIRIPYQQMVSYFGYVKPGSKPDEVKDGKNYYYLYLWIPLAAPEIGIRMVSPVKDLAKPQPTDFVAPDWAEGSKDIVNYFDTYITFERAIDVLVPGDITKAATAKWITYESNDDSSEVPAQPSGSRYNSLMRIKSTLSDPLKAITRGLYRVGFTTYKVGEVQGTFLAQIGAPISLPGVAVAKDPESLQKLVK